MSDLEGREIASVRRMTEEEVEGELWTEGTVALELDDGTVLYPSRDLEGNGPGALFGDDGDEKFAVMPDE